MSSTNTTTTKIALARNGHIAIDLARLFNDTENGVQRVLFEAFAMNWATLLNISRPGNANQIAAMGTEIFGEAMEKATIACIEVASPQNTTKDKVRAKNGHNNIGSMGGKDTAVMKLAGLFWLLVGAKRMGQAERIRVIGKEVQREGGMEFEETVVIMGKQLLE